MAQRRGERAHSRGDSRPQAHVHEHRFLVQGEVDIEQVTIDSPLQDLAHLWPIDGAAPDDTDRPQPSVPTRPPPSQDPGLGTGHLQGGDEHPPEGLQHLFGHWSGRWFGHWSGRWSSYWFDHRSTRRTDRWSRRLAGQPRGGRLGGEHDGRAAGPAYLHCCRDGG